MAKLRKKLALPAPPMLVAAEDWPANRQESRSVASLVPYARNARTHSERQVHQIAGLIGKFGWTSRPLIDEAGMLLAGHGRILAANLLGIKDVPVMVALGWSEAQKRAYIVADNKVAENAGWDKELLAGELAFLDDADFDLELSELGFTDAELNRLMPEDEREGHTDADAAPAAGDGEPVSRIGDIWLLGEHRLMCGDSTSADHVAALLGTDKPHLMVTDPPYGVEYDPGWREEAEWLPGHQTAADQRAEGEVANDDRADWCAAYALFPGDVAYVWHASLFGPEVCASMEACGFERRYQIIWSKIRHIIGRGDYHWRHEPCWYMVRACATGHWQGSRSQFTVWSDIEHVKSETGHGTQKPIECMARPMRNNSAPGALVYDPFCGSGTTIIAGEMLARRVRAMEIMPAYVDVAVRRWEGFTKKTAILAAGELTRAEVAAERGVRLAA